MFPWYSLTPKESSMLPLYELHINHNGWNRDMLKYPENVSRITTDKMDEMSMLSLRKLVMSHNGWIRGMVKYP